MLKFYKNSLFFVILIFLCSNLFATKYAGEIFRMGAGVKNFALGNCGLTDENSYAPAYWNSALLIKATNNKFEIMHAEEYMGLLTYDTASAIWGNENKFSLVITRIGIADIPLTKLTDPTIEPDSLNRPYEYKSVNNSDLVVYFGFARKIGNYNIGFTPKIAYRHLAEENGFGFGADISTFFELSEKWMIAAKIRDFFTTQILWGNGTHEIVNPGFDLETKYKFIFPVIKRSSNFYTGFEIFTENRGDASNISLSFFSLDYHLGLEMNIHEKADLYIGYDINHFTSGISIGYRNWKINYSLELDTNDLDNSHRVSISLDL